MADSRPFDEAQAVQGPDHEFLARAAFGIMTDGELDEYDCIVNALQYRPDVCDSRLIGRARDAVGNWLKTARGEDLNTAGATRQAVVSDLLNRCILDPKIPPENLEDLAHTALWAGTAIEGVKYPPRWYKSVLIENVRDFTADHQQRIPIDRMDRVVGSIRQTPGFILRLFQKAP